MSDSFSYLASGLLFGLAAGISPGPLLALVISETLAHNRTQGIKVAFSPLFTDTPIILLSVFVLLQFSRYREVLGILSLVGAAYIIFLGIKNVRVRPLEKDFPPEQAHSLRKGIITNLLNPHPYLFWITIGAPLIIKAAGVHWTGPVFFLAGFYFCIVGVKILITLLTAASKNILTAKSYIYFMRFLGLVLMVFALFFIRDGLELLGII
jgi:threonine/homoserine/homoserine lactone efflux protein